MSPQTKMTARWIVTTVGCVVGILATVIGSTVSITTKFNKNDLDHTVITSTINAEVKRSTDIDDSRSREVEKINDKLDKIENKQVEVVTNQKIIIKAIEEIPN